MSEQRPMSKQILRRGSGDEQVEEDDEPGEPEDYEDVPVDDASGQDVKESIFPPISQRINQSNFGEGDEGLEMGRTNYPQ